MRTLLLLLTALGIVILGLSNTTPGVAGAPVPVPTDTPVPTPLPEGFTLIPPFTPSYPCELQGWVAQDDNLCRYESVQESILVQGAQVTFIKHDYHMGEGCWGSINQDIHELRTCNQTSGAITTLTSNLTTNLILSPDGVWFAFGEMSPMDADGRSLVPHVYRVRQDGSDLQRLDTQGFPDFTVGAPGHLRWVDDDWLTLDLWDGTGDDGYHAFRLKSDGSGVYEALPAAVLTRMP